MDKNDREGIVARFNMLEDKLTQINKQLTKLNEWNHELVFEINKTQKEMKKLSKTKNH